MRNHPRLLTFFVATVIMGCSHSTDVADESSPAVLATSTSGLYSVDDYDPDRDAHADLLTTIEQAKESNKRIILEIGGQW